MTTRTLISLCTLMSIIVAGTPAFMPGPASAATSALKCRAVRGTIDKTICESPEYLAMDREVGALVDLADARFSPDNRRRLGESQTRYLEKRGGCDWAAHHSAHPGAAVDECLRGVMEARVRTLRAAVDRGGF